jgi:hypothetical protein
MGAYVDLDETLGMKISKRRECAVVRRSLGREQAYQADGSFLCLTVFW